jgi:hypothetical protein
MRRIMDRMADLWRHVEALERGTSLRNASISGGQGLRILDADGNVQAQIAPDRTITVFDIDSVPVVRMGEMQETGPQLYGIEVRVNTTDWIQLGTQAVAWANVGDKPTAYDSVTELWDPSAHTHPGADVTSRVSAAVDAIGSASGWANNVQGTQFYALWVGNDGQYSLGRNTSSIRYKMNVRDVTLIDPDRVLQLRPRIFDRKAQYKAPTDEEGNRLEGPELQVPGAVDEFGLIAEEVQLCVPELVQWFDGLIDGVRYDLLGVALLPVVQRQEQKITALETQVNSQATTIEKLVAAIQKLGGTV